MQKKVQQIIDGHHLGTVPFYKYRFGTGIEKTQTIPDPS